MRKPRDREEYLGPQLTQRLYRKAYELIRDGVDDLGVMDALGVDHRQLAIAKAQIQRGSEAAVRWQAGETLDSIGRSHGLSRERVRQLISIVREPGMADRARLRRKAQKHLKEQGALDSRLGEAGVSRAAVIAEFDTHWSVGAAAAALGLTRELVREVLDAAGIRHLGNKVRQGQKYSDEQLLLYLRLTAQELGSEMITGTQYDEVASRQTLTPEAWPSRQLYGLRFGSWTGACHAAGLDSGTGRERYRRRYPRSACLKAVIRFIQECDAADRTPTMSRYSRWAMRQEDVPSAATVRNRFDGSWTEAVRSARVAMAHSSTRGA